MLHGCSPAAPPVWRDRAWRRRAERARLGRCPAMARAWWSSKAPLACGFPSPWTGRPGADLVAGGAASFRHRHGRRPMGDAARRRRRRPRAGVVRRYRFAQQAGATARLVLDLDAPASLVRQEIGGRRAPGLSFELGPAETAVAPPARREFTGRNNNLRRTIVVDAGHGGRDPGAIGATGVREKDVVLDAALQLRSALESRGGHYRVALTRDADRFVELEDRVGFARAQNADLFISLHADSHARSRGAGRFGLHALGARRGPRAEHDDLAELGPRSRRSAAPRRRRTIFWWIWPSAKRPIVRRSLRRW